MPKGLGITQIVVWTTEDAKDRSSLELLSPTQLEVIVRSWDLLLCTIPHMFA